MRGDLRTVEKVLLEDEHKLVERLKEGDISALDRIWCAYSETLYSHVIFPKLLNREVSEEVVQNTFLKAIERIGSFKWQAHGVLPWLKAIARNLTMDIYRRRRSRVRLGEGFGQHMGVVFDERQEVERPDRMLVSFDDKRVVRDQVRSVLEGGGLNLRYRKVIELRLFKERTRQECASELGVKVETFDVLFHRALKRFEQLYKQAFGDKEEPGDAR